MAKATRPSTIRIGSARYTVTIDKARCKKRKCEGDSSGNTLQIRLRGDRPHDAEADTVLHEILHQCLYQSGATNKDARDREEKFILALTGPLLGALRDNPILVAWLTRTETV